VACQKRVLPFPRLGPLLPVQRRLTSLARSGSLSSRTSRETCSIGHRVLKKPAKSRKIFAKNGQFALEACERRTKLAILLTCRGNYFSAAVVVRSCSPGKSKSFSARKSSRKLFVILLNIGLLASRILVTFDHKSHFLKISRQNCSHAFCDPYLTARYTFD
jgi:hypothetical protein